tara:strand:+ start:512 stop:631 length:120 start_codon:yes stop_codon:yes gene_type:complete
MRYRLDFVVVGGGGGGSTVAVLWIASASFLSPVEINVAG